KKIVVNSTYWKHRRSRHVSRRGLLRLPCPRSKAESSLQAYKVNDRLKKHPDRFTFSAKRENESLRPSRCTGWNRVHHGEVRAEVVSYSGASDKNWSLCKQNYTTIRFWIRPTRPRQTSCEFCLQGHCRVYASR